MARKSPRERAAAHAGKILRAYHELAKVTGLEDEAIEDLDVQLSGAHGRAMDTVRFHPTEFQFREVTPKAPSPTKSTARASSPE